MKVILSCLQKIYIFFGKQKFDVRQLNLNKFINLFCHLIISTSNSTFEVTPLRPSTFPYLQYLVFKNHLPLQKMILFLNDPLLSLLLLLFTCHIIEFISVILDNETFISWRLSTNDYVSLAISFDLIFL